MGSLGHSFKCLGNYPIFKKWQKANVEYKHSLSSVAVVELQIGVCDYWLQKQFKAQRTSQLPAKC